MDILDLNEDTISTFQKITFRNSNQMFVSLTQLSFTNFKSLCPKQMNIFNKQDTQAVVFD